MWNAFTLFCLTFYPRTENRKCILLPLNIIWWGNYILQGLSSSFLRSCYAKMLAMSAQYILAQKETKKAKVTLLLLAEACLFFSNMHWVLKEFWSFFESMVEIVEGSLKNVSDKICDNFLTPQWDCLGKWLLVSLRFIKSPFYMHMQNNFTVQVSFKQATTIKASMVIVLLWLLQNLPRERERKVGSLSTFYFVLCILALMRLRGEGLLHCLLI